jgi:hypothetical protein
MKIKDYLSPDALCIQIRKRGGSAYVERIDGKDVVVTNRSLAWVRRLTHELNWVTPR